MSCDPPVPGGGPAPAEEIDTARFFELSLDLLCVTDLEGIIRGVNPSYQRVLGYAPDEVIGRPFIELLHPDDVEPSLGALSGLQEGRDLDLIDCRVRCKDGSWKWLSCTARAPAPGSQFVYSVCRDVTRQKELESALREGEYRLHQLLNNTTAVVYIKDLDGRYLFFNRQFARLFNVDLAVARGQTDFEFFPPAMAEAFRQNDEAVARSGEILQIEEVAPHADGPHTYVSIKFPLRDTENRINAVAGISTDITDRIERLRVEEEIVAAREVQRILYPPTAPRVPGFELAGATFPASHVCGDYFDYIPLPDGRLVVAVGDVSGHGLGPALEMVGTRAYLRAMLMAGQGLGAVLPILNEVLTNDLPDGMFVSLFAVTIDNRTRTAEYAGAGHEALLIHADGAVHRLRSTGTVLGLMHPAEFDVASISSLESGDLLVLITDGVIESMSADKTLYGWKRLTELCRSLRRMPAQEVVHLIYGTVSRFSERRVQKDDMTIVAVRVL